MHYPHFGFQHSVLIIDDFGKSAKMVQGGLLVCPIQFAFCASDYDQAMEKIKTVKPDLLVVSLDFVKGSVVDFAEKIRQNFTHLPSIYLTEPHLLNFQIAVLNLGGEFDVISHPVSEPSELIHRMDRAVQELSNHRERRAQVTAA